MINNGNEIATTTIIHHILGLLADMHGLTFLIDVVDEGVSVEGSCWVLAAPVGGPDGCRQMLVVWVGGHLVDQLGDLGGGQSRQQVLQVNVRGRQHVPTEMHRSRHIDGGGGKLVGCFLYSGKLQIINVIQDYNFRSCNISKQSSDIHWFSLVFYLIQSFLKSTFLLN